MVIETILDWANDISRCILLITVTGDERIDKVTTAWVNDEVWLHILLVYCVTPVG